MKERNNEQTEVVQNYMRAGPDRCTLELSTGFGKSKIAIDILKHVKPKKVLLLVNSTVLRDDSWKVEFEKFNFLDYYEENVETATYQLVYKWKSEERDLTDYFIVADEVDFASDVPELSKFFYEYPDNKVLGLTGFVTGNKREWFTIHLPIFKTLTANDAQEKGILNQLHFVFVKYDLSKNPKDIRVEYTKGGQKKSFHQSENKAYEYRDKKVTNVIISKSILTEEFLAGKMAYDKYLKDSDNLDYLGKMAARERSELLINSVSSAEIAKKLIQYKLKENSKNKIVVFSKRTAQSEKICGKDNMYNGKVSKAKGDALFKAFQLGEERLLGTCDKLNRGVNVPNLNVAILESFYGSDTQAVQRLGRMMRLSPDEIATVIILLPHFMRETTRDNETVYVSTPTQQVKWAERMLKSTTIKSSEVWDYRASKDE